MRGLVCHSWFPPYDLARLFLVVGDHARVFVLLVGDAAHGHFCWPRQARSFRRFLLQAASLSDWRRIPNWQGTLVAVGVALWRRVDIAATRFCGSSSSMPSCPRRTPPGSQVFTLVQVVLRVMALRGVHACPLLGARCRDTELSLALSRWCFDFTPSYAQGTRRVGLGSHGSLSLVSEFDATAPLARAGAVPTTGNAPPSLCATTPGVQPPPHPRSRPHQQAQTVNGLKDHSGLRGPTARFPFCSAFQTSCFALSHVAGRQSCFTPW